MYYNGYMLVQAVIIDFDDTLYLSEEACFKLENEVLRRMERPPQTRAIHRETWGMPLASAITLRSPGINADEFWRILEPTQQEYVKNGHLDQIPDANIQVLDTLIAHGLTVFILTSRTYPEVQHLLDPDHHLAGRVVKIYHADNTTHLKPDPRVFDNLLAEHPSFTPANCVYVGDSPSDGVAAKNAGMHFIASLESGLRSIKDFDDIAVDATIAHFSELPKAVASL